MARRVTTLTAAVYMPDAVRGGRRCGPEVYPNASAMPAKPLGVEVNCATVTGSKTIIQIKHSGVSSFNRPLKNVTLPEIPQAVFYGIGYFQAGHVDAVAVRFGVFEDRAHLTPVVKVIEGLLR